MMMKAAVALVAAAFASASQVPAPRSPPLRAVVISLSPYTTPRCPDLSLADGLQFRNAAAWPSDPHGYWFVVDADGQLIGSLQQLLFLNHAHLRVWGDRNRNGVIEPSEARPFGDVVTKVDPVTTRVDGSYVCRAQAAVEISPSRTKGFHPAATAAQTAWEIEITTDATEAVYRYGSTPVAGLKATLSTAGDRYVVNLTNDRQSPVQAFYVGIERRPSGGGSGMATDMYRTERRQLANGEWYGPILPGETRAVTFGRVSQEGPSVEAVVRAVLFEDMYFEGRHAERTQWFETRDAYAASLEAWLPALRAAAQERDPAQGRRILEKKLAERQASIRSEVRQSSADATLEQLVPRLATGEAPFSQLLDFVIARFEVELKLATRHRSSAGR